MLSAMVDGVQQMSICCLMHPDYASLAFLSCERYQRGLISAPDTGSPQVFILYFFQYVYAYTTLVHRPQCLAAHCHRLGSKDSWSYGL